MTSRVRVRRDGFSLSAMESGQGAGAPVVILSNSLGATLDMWAPQRKRLGGHFRVIGYDTRGHGASDTPAGPYSFADLVADGVAVMDHFGVERAHWVGLSLGGMTGLGMGLDAPGRVNKLVCCAARADAPEPFLKSWDDRIAAIKAGGIRSIWPGTLERWLTADFQAANPEIVDQLTEDFAATTGEGYAGCAAALKGLDYLRRLGDMTVPTLFIAGEADMGAPVAAMQAMHAATPGSQIAVIPDAAHIINLNAPAAFDAALTEFLLA